MPITTLNGIRLNYEVTGTGPLVLMIMGSGSPGRVWKNYQVPALVKAGFRVATYDSRGIAPSDECADGIRMTDLVGDAAALIELLGAPAHVVGHSMGARVTLELALARPELVDRTVTMGAVARSHPLSALLNAGEQALYDKDVQLPPQYAAAIKAMLNLSPASVADPAKAQEWLDIFEFTSGAKTAPGVRAQLGMDRSEDRRTAYTRITKPSLVIGFADDRMTPAAMGREVAQAIPGARYTELEQCGHFGYLEQPEAVNQAIVGFLTGAA
ncbi:alpha/beta fold hydrolase [Nocardia stercoris]|uniref:Alpha/beta hydrolase n=1 Tax=Nocardia stercoris TaxID=2483361 RepID=A0A3M2L869_9NOCA|nr:alpha/beta hydrolase [Nocardia stercoris]RMI32703.1 alpha/beta hydrolase [Nocardia stercoris]